MVQDIIEAMLRQKLGLDVNSVGSRMIERAVEQRQIACQIPDRTAYLARLRSYPEEFNQLIEAVVVPETWFFRDREPFEYLRYYGQAFSEKAFHRKKPENTVLRVLSLPCSTGEEPYSIAMALLDAGLTTAQFGIDAVDISQQALLKASQGIYRRNSFRGGVTQHLAHYLEQYFHPIPEGYQVRSIVQKSVNFIQGNALEPNFLLGKQYHVIFCRNLLIYLEQAARDRLMETLDRALFPAGLLLLGSAETTQIASKSYQAIDHPFAFAYQKDLSPKTAPFKNYRLNSPKQQRQESAKTVHAKIRLPPLPPRSPAPPLPLSPAPPPSTPTPLENAKHLADRGQLTQAAQICESYLRANPTQPIAYLLLGEIYQGLNQSRQAEQCFQKAVYLNPNAYEALIHLALLKEQQGKPVESERLRRRAQRLMNAKNV